jgi:hypothetical protein
MAKRKSTKWQRSAKHAYKTKDWVTKNKGGGEWNQMLRKG